MKRWKLLSRSRDTSWNNINNSHNRPSLRAGSPWVTRASDLRAKRMAERSLVRKRQESDFLVASPLAWRGFAARVFAARVTQRWACSQATTGHRSVSLWKRCFRFCTYGSGQKPNIWIGTVYTVLHARRIHFIDYRLVLVGTISTNATAVRQGFPGLSKLCFFAHLCRSVFVYNRFL